MDINPSRYWVIHHLPIRNWSEISVELLCSDPLKLIFHFFLFSKKLKAVQSPKMRTFALLATFLFMAGTAWYSPSNGALRGRRALRLAAAATASASVAASVPAAAADAAETETQKVSKMLELSFQQLRREAKEEEDEKEETRPALTSAEALLSDVAIAAEPSAKLHEMRRAQASAFEALEAFEAAAAVAAATEAANWNWQDHPLRRMAGAAGGAGAKRVHMPDRRPQMHGGYRRRRY
jgi:hypothetical protein